MQRLKYLALTLLATLAMAALPVQAERSPEPKAVVDATHPWVMQAAGDQVARAAVGVQKPFTPVARSAVGGAGGPQREVFGFALASSLADGSVGYPSWKFSLLSTVAF